MQLCLCRLTALFIQGRWLKAKMTQCARGHGDQPSSISNSKTLPYISASYIFNLLLSCSIISPGKISGLKRNLQIPFDLSLGVQGVPLLRDSPHCCPQRRSTWTQSIASQVSTVTLLMSLGGNKRTPCETQSCGSI